MLIRISIFILNIDELMKMKYLLYTGIQGFLLGEVSYIYIYVRYFCINLDCIAMCVV